MSYPEYLRWSPHPTGAHILIAIDSTRRGPAVGGCRWWSYSHLEKAKQDVVQLARAMTLKAAVAHLPHGGGKAVVHWPHSKPATLEQRHQIWQALAERLDHLDGRYITAEDVGTSSADTEYLSGLTPWVIGLPEAAGGVGDPAPFTAAGVFEGLRVCAQRIELDLAGKTATIVGLGQVGMALAHLLAEAGLQLQGCDLNPDRQAELESLGGRWLLPEQALAKPGEILLPCALGGQINAQVGDEQLKIICGAANNPLKSDEEAERLQRRGIVYAPDYVVNAGGLMAVCAELECKQADRQVNAGQVLEAVRRQVGQRTGEVLEHATVEGITTLQAANQQAMQALAA